MTRGYHGKTPCDFHIVLHNGGTSWLDVAIHKDPNRLVTGAEARRGATKPIGHIFRILFSGEVAGWCISQLGLLFHI